jgi:ABC-type siderophore export system fused ATPase/permease subunit
MCKVCTVCRMLYRFFNWHKQSRRINCICFIRIIYMICKFSNHLPILILNILVICVVQYICLYLTSIYNICIICMKVLDISGGCLCVRFVFMFHLMVNHFIECRHLCNHGNQSNGYKFINTEAHTQHTWKNIVMVI